MTHLNIRSLWKSIDELRAILFESKKDCFTISETWLTENLLSNMVGFHGYNFVSLDRECLNADGSIKTDGGVGAYINAHYDLDQFILKDLNTSNENIECMLLSI